MAISAPVEYLGFSVGDCYISIPDGNLILSKESIIFSVTYRTSRSEYPFKSASFECRYVQDGDNPFSQSYHYLKTLPEFSDAVDC